MSRSRREPDSNQSWGRAAIAMGEGGAGSAARWPGAGSESWNMLTYPPGCGRVPAVARRRIRSAPAPPMRSRRNYDFILLIM